jgi:ATP-dependent helicase/nuclease subunit B
MHIYFGMEFDDLVHAEFYESGHIEGMVHYLGPNRLLELMEAQLGLGVLTGDNEFLRVEQMRQAISKLLENQSEGIFFKKSFEADQLATAAKLLQMRDELLLAGWNFEPSPELPPRLHALSSLHHLLAGTLSLGHADRYAAVLRTLPERRLPIERLCLNEPIDLMPNYLQKIFNTLKTNGTGIEQLFAPKANGGETDLARLQQRLLQAEGDKTKVEARADGSLLLIRAKRETDTARCLAQIFKDNPKFRPLCLIPDKSRTLDAAIVQEGLPSMGIVSASLGRPTLQLLKLVTTFLWEPLDPFKVMEFVSLPIKPLDEGLGNIIANEMADMPGIRSDRWVFAIRSYLEDLQAHSKNAQAVGDQYAFWFERKRYKLSAQVPKNDARGIYAFLTQWAMDEYKATGNKNGSLLVLVEQSKRICELLDELPEQDKSLSYLELERIVRTIYEPSPLAFQETQVGHLHYIHNHSALLCDTAELLWWNFAEGEPTHSFQKWYAAESAYFEKNGIVAPSPEMENARLLWQQKLPLLRSRNRVVLVIPQKIDGQEVVPHPLYGDIKACFNMPELLECNIDDENAWQRLGNTFKLPPKIEIDPRKLGKPKPFILTTGASALTREEETFTSLEALLHYPYKWFFKYKIKLTKSSILSVAKGNRLMGNLAHRFMELLLQEDIDGWQRQEVEHWIDRSSHQLLAREGAVLLLYGREPEKAAFLNRMKGAAWALVRAIQQNGWQVAGTEERLEGDFDGTAMKGKADLVLQQGDELAIIDIKWSGTSRRINEFKNEEDLQLVLYADLLRKNGAWPHTAFFIINEQGKIIARNNLAFKEAHATTPGADHRAVSARVLERMKATYRWRLQQLAQGKIEVRTAHTSRELEEEYGMLLMEMLEMKNEDAPFDDYRVLVNLVE